MHEYTITNRPRNKAQKNLPRFPAQIFVSLQNLQSRIPPIFIHPRYDELTTAALSSGKCAASDSKYCVLVVGSDGRTKTFSDIFLGAANDMFKDPVRVFSVHPTKDITLKKKLSPILLQLTEDPSIVLWRPKRQRWTVFPPAGGKSFVALVKSGKAREEVVQWVRGQIDGGGQLPNRHEEL